MGTHIHTDTHTDTHTDRQTDRHTDIHKGNNNEIKYTNDITAIKNDALSARLNAIRWFLPKKWINK